LKRSLTPHEDDTLNLLRLFAMSAVGVYLYKSYKQEGSLLGATGKPTKFTVNTDKIVDHFVEDRVLNHHIKKTIFDIKKDMGK
jgi:hypothetical protein